MGNVFFSKQNCISALSFFLDSASRPGASLTQCSLGSNSPAQRFRAKGVSRALPPAPPLPSPVATMLSSALPAIIERLDRAEGPALDAVLEEARGALDLLPQESMGPPVAAMLLRWPAECPASAQRERCRLVSYAAIMHGCSLLSALPAVWERI